jgi:DNA-binding MarR family transcriptional regulator
MMQLHRNRREFAVAHKMQEPSDAVTDAWVRLIRAQKAVVGQIEAELKAAGFPSLSWYDVLLHLKRLPDGRCSPREIEETMLFEQYNLSRLLDRMEAEGLVRRVPFPGDKRRQLVEITTEGRALQKRMWSVYGPAINRFIGGPLTEAEAGQLAAHLLKLMQPKNDPA